MLTRKHYNAISAILRQERAIIDHDISDDVAGGRYFTVSNIERDLVDLLQKDNPRFDKQRFLNASR